MFRTETSEKVRRAARSAVLQPEAQAPRRNGTKAWRLQGGVQEQNGTLSALARKARARAGRAAADRHHPLCRQEAGADRVARTGQERYPRCGIPDCVTAARDAQGQAASIDRARPVQATR